MKKSYLWFWLLVVFLQRVDAQAITDNPSPEERLFETARTDFEQKLYLKVIAKMKDALQLNPNYAEAYALRGHAQLELGNCAEAVTDFQTALEKKPFQPDYIVDLLEQAKSCTSIPPPPDPAPTIEVLWELPQSDFLRVEVPEYTLKVCVKAAKGTLMHNDEPAKTANRGTRPKTLHSDCTETIQMDVTLKPGRNRFHVQVGDQKSSSRTIIWMQNARIALVIGNNDYKGDQIDLGEVPLRDAALMRDSLEKCGFEVSYHQDLNKKELEKVINIFVQQLEAYPYEAALFYFAGHGLLIQKYGFILPIDAVLKYPKDVEEQCISLDLLKNKMTSSKAQLSIVLTDACRNDPFQALEQQIAEKPLHFNMGTQNVHGNPHFVAYPAGEGQKIVNKGWFTAEWVKQMMIHLNVKEVMDRTIDAVQARSEKKQRPHYDTNFTKSFFFKR